MEQNLPELINQYREIVDKNCLKSAQMRDFSLPWIEHSLYLARRCLVAENKLRDKEIDLVKQTNDTAVLTNEVMELREYIQTLILENKGLGIRLKTKERNWFKWIFEILGYTR